MKVKVNQDLCIRCGACVSTCPDVFSFNDDGDVIAIEDNVDIEDEEKALEALDGCPTNAIEKEEND